MQLLANINFTKEIQKNVRGLYCHLSTVSVTVTTAKTKQALKDYRAN